MKEIIITSKRFITSDNEFNHYIININGSDVRVHEKINGDGFGLSMKDLCKAFGYISIDELKQSEEWKTLNEKIGNPGAISRLKSSNENIDNEPMEKGVSTIYSSPAFWAGGTFDQAINLAENPYRTDDVVSFLVTHSGLAILNQALVRGTIESNKNGNRIILDPQTRSFKLIDDDKGLVGVWHFFDSGSIIQVFHKPSSNQIDETQINGNTINFSTRNTLSGFALHARVGVTGAKFDIKSFPTKERLAELEIGELYRDGDVIKMKIAD